MSERWVPDKGGDFCLLSLLDVLWHADWPGGHTAWAAQEPVNAHSHLLSVLVGNTLTVPIHKGKMVLGTWQVGVWVRGWEQGGSVYLSGRTNASPTGRVKKSVGCAGPIGWAKQIQSHVNLTYFLWAVLYPQHGCYV